MLQQNFRWTDANSAILVEMLNTNKTAAEVAERLGTSPPAVFGRARRLGLNFHSGVKFSWTEDRLKKASALWMDGVDAAEIAKVLGCQADNFRQTARRHREYFPKRRMARDQPAPKPLKLRDHRPHDERSFTANSVPFLLPDFPGVRFADTKPHHCRFPVSNDAGPDMLCCGAEATRGSYCGVHAMIARGRGTESERKAVSVGRIGR